MAPRPAAGKLEPRFGNGGGMVAAGRATGVADGPMVAADPVAAGLRWIRLIRSLVTD